VELENGALGRCHYTRAIRPRYTGLDNFEGMHPYGLWRNRNIGRAGYVMAAI